MVEMLLATRTTPKAISLLQMFAFDSKIVGKCEILDGEVYGKYQ